MNTVDDLIVVGLRRSCESGDVDALRTALDAGASPDQPLDATGTTPLMVAASVDVVAALLAAGATTSVTRFGRDALDVVVSDLESAIDGRDARAAAARLLVAHGTPVGRRDANGWSRLYVAAFGADPGAVALLLELGADPNDEPAPLAAACWGTSSPGRTTGVIDLLVAAGADVDVTDPAGWTLLHAAAMPYGHGQGFESSDGPNPDAITALVRHGHPVDPTGPGGVTPLMLAAGDGDPDAVDALLAAGAHVRLRDHAGRAAGDHAREADERFGALLDDAPAAHLAVITERQVRAARCVSLLADR